MSRDAWWFALLVAVVLVPGGGPYVGGFVIGGLILAVILTSIRGFVAKLWIRWRGPLSPVVRTTCWLAFLACLLLLGILGSDW